MSIRNKLERPLAVRGRDGGPPRYPVKEALAGVRTTIYRGNKVECSCCGGGFSLFLYSPYMAALCPNCLSYERYRLLCRFLSEETDFRSGAPLRVLDIAPVWCFQEYCRQAGVDYISIDIQSPLAMRLMNIKELYFPNDSFDRIFCYHVLEHIDDEQRALRELYRVLKPGAWSIIQVPIFVEKTIERHELSASEQEDILKFKEHLRGYGRDYPERLEAAGFEVEINQYVKKFNPEEIKRYGLDKTEDIYICHKPPGV